MDSLLPRPTSDIVLSSTKNQGASCSRVYANNYVPGTSVVAGRLWVNTFLGTYVVPIVLRKHCGTVTVTLIITIELLWYFLVLCKSTVEVEILETVNLCSVQNSVKNVKIFLEPQFLLHRIWPNFFHMISITHLK